MYLFFDTETTRLPFNYKAPPSQGLNWPNIVQFAYAVFDVDGHLIHKRCSIIKPDGWEIEASATAIHGISMEKAKKEGISLENIMNTFIVEHRIASFSVCHNTGFDFPVVQSEIMRLGINYDIYAKAKICTMESSTNLCKLPGKYHGYKWPKLEELYYYLFDKYFDNAHDALGDVIATARCFSEMKRTGALNI